MYLEIKKPYFSSNKRKKQGKRAIADLLKKQKNTTLQSIFFRHFGSVLFMEKQRKAYAIACRYKFKPAYGGRITSVRGFHHFPMQVVRPPYEGSRTPAIIP